MLNLPIPALPQLLFSMILTALLLRHLLAITYILLKPYIYTLRRAFSLLATSLPLVFFPIISITATSISNYHCPYLPSLPLQHH